MGGIQFTLNLENNDKRFDLLELKTKFDEDADSSPIRYALSIKNLTEYLILQFENYVVEKADILDEFNNNSLLPELVPNVKKVRTDLKKFNTDAMSIYSLFTNAKDLQDLQNLNFAREEYYPPFNLVAEILTEKIRQVILRVEIFELMPNFVHGVCAGEKDFSPQIKTASEIILDLVSYVIDGHLRQEIVKKTAAERILEILNSYRASLEDIQEKFKEDNPFSHMEEKVRRQGKICKSSLKEIEETLIEEPEKLWVQINCIGKISG